jgi:hypothetical protein
MDIVLRLEYFFVGELVVSSRRRGLVLFYHGVARRGSSEC